MLLFAISAALLLLLALAAIIVPLFRAGAAHSMVDRNDANLQILRDQLDELELDLRNGVLSAEQHESARAELERRVLDESQKGGTTDHSAGAGRSRLAAVFVGVLLPVAAVWMYLHLGNTDGLDVNAYLQQQASQITPEKVAQMTQRLVEHLEANPDDVEGWAMLARARRAMQQFDASAQAWQRAAALRPDDPNVLTDYAEALAIAAQGDLEGEPTRLLARALQLEPAHTKALALGGSAAFARSDYRTAIEHWQKLLALSGADEELANALETGIAEARARLGQTPDDPEQSSAIVGRVSLSPQLLQSVSPDDTVFIFARPAQGPGMPLAVTRVKAAQLPYQFRLDDSMAMTPERKISNFQQLVVGARVSKRGGATRASGDLEGFSATVAFGASDVKVVIDQRVP